MNETGLSIRSQERVIRTPEEPSSEINYNKNENTSTNKSFCGRAIRIASAALLVIPYIVMNLGAGIITGLAISTIGIANLSHAMGVKIGTPGTRCGVACGFACMCVGAIFTTIVIAPLLVSGAVGGLCVAAYKFPHTMQQCVEDGFCVAARKTVDRYDLGTIQLSINTSLYSVVH